MKCPVCNKKTKSLAVHIESHGFASIEDLYIEYKLSGRPPICSCKLCNERPTFISWTKGFRAFKQGHNGAYKTSYNIEQSKTIRENKSRSLRGKKPWSKGKTAKDSTIIQQSLEKLKSSLKEKSLRRRSQRLENVDILRIVQKLEKYAPGFKIIENTDKSAMAASMLYMQCTKCGFKQIKHIVQAASNKCDKCDPVGAQSHIDIYRFVRTIDPDTIISCDSIMPPDDVDIFVPSKSTAIEYNGLYFHSELFKHRLHHAEKSRACSQNGINLIHIFEDEWRDKSNACRNHLKLIMQGHREWDHKIQISSVGENEKSEVLDLRCINGNVKSNINIAAKIDSQIVALVALRLPKHYCHVGKLELVRYYCGAQLPAGETLKRLLTFAHALSGFKKIFSVVDQRLGMSKVYEAAGFNLARKLPPRFWWTDGHIKLDRHKISSVDLDSSNPDPGFVKIWGSDIDVFEHAIR